MTDAAVTYLLEKIDTFLTKELNLPEDVKKGINRLKSELEMIREVLKGSDGVGEQNNPARIWIQQLRDTAYKMEDVIDMYTYQNAQKNAPWYGRWPRMRDHSLMTSINEIETKLKGLNEQKEKYQIQFSSHPASTSTGREQGIAPLYVSEGEIVGVDGPREELASWILDVEQQYKVMFVVGMGGSGKTALVKLVYEQLKADFNCHIWLTASTFEHGKQLLSAMYSKLSNQTGQCPSTLSHEDLIDMLSNFLRGNRYLIVVDDLWNRKVWESVVYAFPGANCSRVIITTRRGDIASSCRDNSVDVYNVRPLPREKARELFYRRAFPESGMHPSAPGLRASCEKLLTECEGLPLGIIEIGKLLANRGRSEFELKKLHDGLQAELDSGQLSSIKQVLLHSYSELPYHLKYCFLYMSMFPGDYSVKRRTLIRLWMAEGFVKEVNGKILEDIGEEYLKELMERNLIQASELDFDGRPRTCRVHRLMHKIALSISEAEIFCTVRGEISEKTRRLSIQNREFNMPNNVICHARTLFTSSLDLKIQPPMISSFMLLNILHLDRARVETFPPGIEELLLLKYLCLSNTNIKRITQRIGRLQHLETLDLKQTFVTTLPDALEKLEKLRHLLVCRYNINAYVEFDAVRGFSAPTEIGKLTNLQKLSFVKADGDHKLIRGLQKLTQLRKLGIIDLPSNRGPILCHTIQMLRNLHSLNMTSLHNEALKIQEINSPPPFLQRLYLKGRLEKMPRWISKLHDLQRIQLKWSKLAYDDNPITILGELPNLLELQLLDAYTGKQLDFDAGTFQKLKILEFERMEELQMVVIENRALPCLQKLIISQCRRLRLIPVGIDSITQLKELRLSDMPPDFVYPLRRNGRMRHLVRHIQKIYSRHLHNGQGAWEDL